MTLFKPPPELALFYEANGCPIYAKVARNFLLDSPIAPNGDHIDNRKFRSSYARASNDCPVSKLIHRVLFVGSPRKMQRIDAKAVMARAMQAKNVGRRYLYALVQGKSDAACFVRAPIETYAAVTVIPTKTPLDTLIARIFDGFFKKFQRFAVGRSQNFQRVAVDLPTFVVHGTPATAKMRLFAAINRAYKLIGHDELPLVGSSAGLGLQPLPVRNLATGGG